MNFFSATSDTSHYWAMSPYNINVYVNAFFAVTYSNEAAFSKADRAGIIFW